jgi:hypothetical protein
MALRLADSAVLPLNYTDYGVALSEYAQQMKTMLAAVKGTDKGTHTPAPALDCSPAPAASPDADRFPFCACGCLLRRACAVVCAVLCVFRVVMCS